MGKNAKDALERAAEAKKEGSLTVMSAVYADQTWLRGLIQAVPYIGGTLDTWMGAPSSAAQKRHVEKFMAETFEHFEKLDENVIDREFIESEEFFILFQQMLLRAAKTHDEEKIKLLSKAFSRAAIATVDSISRDSMIEIIDCLSPAHVLVLRTLVANKPSAQYVTTDPGSEQPIGGFMHASVRWISQNHPELADLPLKIICNDLARFDLLDYERVGTFGNQDDVIAGGARGYRPNEMGQSLIEFLDGGVQRR